MVIEIVDFPIKHGGFSHSKWWIFPLKMVDFPIKHGDFPIQNGDFPIKNGGSFQFAM